MTDSINIFVTNNSAVCHQSMLEELEDISLRVDNVKDQAIILMTSRGPACRDVVEPKLSELNCNFDKVSQHIKTAKVRKHRLSAGMYGCWKSLKMLEF